LDIPGGNFCIRSTLKIHKDALIPDKPMKTQE
jgi:hypothetical protein